MNWDIVEQLAPALAWPIVAIISLFVALPILYWRLQDVTKAIFAIRDLPDTLHESIKKQEKLSEAFDGQMRSANQEIDAIAQKIQDLFKQINIISSDLKSIQDEVQESAIESESSAIENLENKSSEAASQNSHQFIESPEPNRFFESEFSRNSEDMFALAVGKWIAFTETLKSKLTDAGIKFEPNRIEQSIYGLTDRRRRTAVTMEEAKLISKLGRQYRRFIRQANTKNDWMTPEIYMNFKSGIDQATQAVSRTKNSNATEERPSAIAPD